MDVWSVIAQYSWVMYIVLAIILLASYKVIFWLFGIVVVPEDSIGLINKKFVLFGDNKELPQGSIIALNGEPGYQAQTLAPGLYFGFWPWQFSIEMREFIIVETGKIGLLSAVDGAQLSPGRLFGKNIDCDNFQDAVAFLKNGGQRGRQAAILQAGSYRINTFLFEIITVPVTTVATDSVGIVTCNDGMPLPQDEIAGKIITGHENFQNFDAFIENGGQRGLQQQVLLSGNWNINPWAVKVTVQQMTEIEIGQVGVVNSFVGASGTDTSGEEFKHGSIVSRGEKGVWREVLSPGKYAINDKIMKVEAVPTTNLVLNWADARTESHKLDAKLSTITVRSKDGFTFNLDVSQIIHIPALEAPQVISRFGSVLNLVQQVIEPTIGNYFRNSAQNSDVIDFLTKRSDRQKEAKEHIEKVLKSYNVTAVDTLIGDITPPPSLMQTLTDRKIAEEQTKTWTQKEVAEKTRQDFERTRAQADIQPEIVKAERSVEIAERHASAVVKTSEGAAKAVELAARAEAVRIETVAKAEAEKLTVIGTAEGSAILSKGKATAESYKLQVGAMGADNFTKVQVIENISSGKIKVVPDILVGQSNSGSNSLLDGIMAIMLSDKMSAGAKVESAEVVEGKTKV